MATTNNRFVAIGTAKTLDDIKDWFYDGEDPYSDPDAKPVVIFPGFGTCTPSRDGILTCAWENAPGERGKCDGFIIGNRLIDGYEIHVAPDGLVTMEEKEKEDEPEQPAKTSHLHDVPVPVPLPVLPHVL